MPKAIKLPEFGLSVAHIESDSRHVDWRELGGDCGEGFEIIYPAATYGDWAEHSCDLSAAAARIAARYPARPLSDNHLAAFQGTDAYAEWQDSFQPMMNYAWPVTLAYRLGEDEAAAAMGAFAGATTLLKLSEEAAESLYGADDAPEYVIALTGGGMDLSDHLAAAYLACGCVPPFRLLSRLSRVGGTIRKPVQRALRVAYRDAAKLYQRRAVEIRNEAKRVFPRAERKG